MPSALSRRMLATKAVRSIIQFPTLNHEGQSSKSSGSLVICRHNDCAVAITCQHVFGDYSQEDLHATIQLHESFVCRLHGFANLQVLREDAFGSEIDDILFCSLGYVQSELAIGESVDLHEIAMPEEGDRLIAYTGVMDANRTGSRAVAALELEFDVEDVGLTTADIHVRTAAGDFDGQVEWSGRASFSGGLVVREADGLPCGIITRGSISDLWVCVRYVPFAALISSLDFFVTQMR